jgi:hypothetical protein
MTVYVDDMLMKATVPNGNRKVTGRWSHMVADTEEELMEFAKKLGLKASWVQYPGTPKVHFDVVESKRREAIQKGAVPVECRSEQWKELFIGRRRA